MNGGFLDYCFGVIYFPLCFSSIHYITLGFCLCLQEWGTPSCFHSCWWKYNWCKHFKSVLFKACQSRYKWKRSGGENFLLMSAFAHQIVLPLNFCRSETYYLAFPCWWCVIAHFVFHVIDCYRYLCLNMLEFSQFTVSLDEALKIFPCRRFPY